MISLLAYVGVDSRYVLCEKFPNDEDHAGLHELLDDFVNADVHLGENLQKGFYKIKFKLTHTQSPGMFDYGPTIYLELDKLIKL